MKKARISKVATALLLIAALAIPASAYAVPGMGGRKTTKANHAKAAAAAKQAARATAKQAKLAKQIEKVLANRDRAFSKSAGKIESAIASVTALASDVASNNPTANVADVNTALADAKADLDAARIAEADAIAAFKLVPTATDRRAAFSAAKAKAHEARKLLNQARVHLEDAIMKLQGIVTALAAATPPVTSEVPAPAPVPAS